MAAAPAVSSLSPPIAYVGSSAFALTINGSGFVSGSTAYWGSTALATQYVSGTQLTAQVPASAIAVAGTAAVTVQSPAPGGGKSNTLQFEIDSATSPAGAPVFTTTTAAVTAGSAATYTVTTDSSASNISVSCLNLPPGTACSYSNGAVTITTSSSTPSGTYQIVVVFTEAMPGFVFVPLLAPFLLVGRKRRVKRVWLGMLCLAAFATIMIGCGGGSSPKTQTITSSAAVSLTVK